MIDFVTSNDDVNEYDYVVKDIDDLNTLLDGISVPLVGHYSIAFETKDYKTVRQIISDESLYKHIKLTLKISKELFNYVSQAIPNKISEVRVSMLDYLKEGISKRNILMDKDVIYVLYRSIEKTYEDIDVILDLLRDSFPSTYSITKNDLSKYIVINDIIYPREVLVDYINMGRYRKSKLRKCIATVGPDVIIASFVKNIKSLLEAKMKYIDSGLGNNFIKKLNTHNLCLLYYIFCTKKKYKTNDIYLLLYLYERGLTNDILQ